MIEPGTFLDDREERKFLALAKRRLPAAVILEPHPFDFMEDRSVRNTAPLLSAWVQEHYQPVIEGSRFVVIPKDRDDDCL